VHTEALASLTKERMIQYMVGREVNAIYRRDPLPPGEPLLSVTGLSTPDLLHHISLKLHAGEIVGLGGLMGAGRTELCRAIFGLDPISTGTVEVAGRPVTLRTPRQAVAAGIALIPEDRQRTGLARELPIAWNVTMANLDAVSPGGVIRHPEEAKVTQQAIERLRIRCENGKQRAGRLSGGNQQKVVISKWVNRGARVFLFDEPTRGIDVGAKVEVFEVMDQLAREGAAILMVSSELPELLQVADRILVMSQGHLTGELPRGCSQEDIMRLATALPTSGDTLQ
jgi:ABC-type sugar transport system ATPase subunit